MVKDVLSLPLTELVARILEEGNFALLKMIKNGKISAERAYCLLVSSVR